jgi:hypothetical protein
MREPGTRKTSGDTQWVRAKISPFNSRSTGFCASIFKDRGRLLMAVAVDTTLSDQTVGRLIECVTAV